MDAEQSRHIQKNFLYSTVVLYSIVCVCVCVCVCSLTLHHIRQYHTVLYCTVQYYITVVAFVILMLLVPDNDDCRLKLLNVR